MFKAIYDKNDLEENNDGPWFRLCPKHASNFYINLGFEKARLWNGMEDDSLWRAIWIGDHVRFENKKKSTKWKNK